MSLYYLKLKHTRLHKYHDLTAIVSAIKHIVSVICRMCGGFLFLKNQILNNQNATVLVFFQESNQSYHIYCLCTEV